MNIRMKSKIYMIVYYSLAKKVEHEETSLNRMKENREMVFAHYMITQTTN